MVPALRAHSQALDEIFLIQPFAAAWAKLPKRVGGTFGLDGSPLQPIRRWCHGRLLSPHFGCARARAVRTSAAEVHFRQLLEVVEDLAAIEFALAVGSVGEDVRH